MTNNEKGTLLQIRVSTTGLDAWKFAAARDGVTLSEWVRQVLDQAAKPAGQCPVPRPQTPVPQKPRKQVIAALQQSACG